MSEKDKFFEDYGFSPDTDGEESPDFGSFMHGAELAPTVTDLPAEDPTAEAVPETPTEAIPEATPAEAPAAPTESFNYMATMQSMFQALSNGPKEATTSAPTEAPAFTQEVPVEETEEEAPEEAEVATTVPASEESTAPVTPEEPVSISSDHLPEEMPIAQSVDSLRESDFAQFIQPDETGTGADSFQNAPESPSGEAEDEGASNQQPISEVEAEKPEDYWNYIDSILDYFDDGQIHTAMSENARPSYYGQEFSREETNVENEVAPELVEDVAPVPVASVKPRATAKPEAPVAPVTVAKDATTVEPSTTASEASSAPTGGYFTNNRPTDAYTVDQALASFDSTTSTTLDEAYDEADEAVAEEELSPRELRALERQEKKDAKLAKKESKKKDSTAKQGEKSKKKGGIFPKKGDNAAEVLRKIVMILSILILIGCAIYFVNAYVQHKREADTNAAQKAAYEAYLQANEEETEEKWNAVKAKYPNVDFPDGMMLKMAGLYAENQDLVGWLSIEGLDMNYPIVQSDDNDYYLRHTWNKEYSVYGAPFMDSYNNAKDLDANTVLYGHSMRRDDQMFTPLKTYKTIDGFKANPTFTYSTLYADYTFKVYAVFITNGTAEGDNGYLFNYHTKTFIDDQNFSEFMEEIDQRALYTTGVDVQVGDKLMTLSTCTYDFDEARLVVVGRMVREGESEEVDTSLAKTNKNPRYPQAWYDAKGTSNPYKNAEKWVPGKS